MQGRFSRGVQVRLLLSGRYVLRWAGEARNTSSYNWEGSLEREKRWYGQKRRGAELGHAQHPNSGKGIHRGCDAISVVRTVTRARSLERLRPCHGSICFSTTASFLRFCCLMSPTGGWKFSKQKEISYHFVKEPYTLCIEESAATRVTEFRLRPCYFNHIWGPRRSIDSAQRRIPGPNPCGGGVHGISRSP